MRDLFVQKYFSIHLCFIGERKLILFLLFSTRCGSPSPCKPSPPHQKANSSTVKREWDTEPGLRLVHALTTPFLRSFRSLPRLSAYPCGQNAAHKQVLTRARVLHLCLTCQPWGKAVSRVWEVASTKLAPWKLSAASCGHRQSLWEMELFGFSPPCSLLPCLHPGTSDAQAAPKLIQGVRSRTQSRPKGHLLLPSQA